MSTDVLAQLIASLASGSIKVVDLSQNLSPSTPVIGLPPFDAGAVKLTVA